MTGLIPGIRARSPLRTWPTSISTTVRSGAARARGRRGQPVAQLVVDRRVVQQREVKGSADVVAVLLVEADPPRAADARSARLQHETVADQSAERVARAA